MVVSEIEALLQSAMGLQVDTIGRASLERAVQRRMKALNLKEPAAYVQRLKQASAELNELIEEVVIPETWFFRDTQPFEALLHYLADRGLDRRKDNVFLRLLSAPCATGEEPYSLAITLLQAGWLPHQFQVFAMDISTRALARAQRAEYTEHSFRGQGNDFKNRYFTKVGTNFVRYVLNRDIRQQVLFHHGNLLDPTFMGGLGVFDILFCRNVLIYLDAGAREQAIGILHKMLSSDGLLLVGHAEAALFNDQRFEAAPYRRAFAFYKNNDVASEARDEPASFPRPRRLPAAARGPTSRRPAAKRAFTLPARSAPTRPAAHPRPTDASSSEKMLAQARQLADQGRLEEAAEMCEIYLRHQGPSAQAYFLLGVIQDAGGHVEEAVKMFRKAVYLKPDYSESLVYLALYAQRAGNQGEARTLRQRLARLEARKKM